MCGTTDQLCDGRKRADRVCDISCGQRTAVDAQSELPGLIATPTQHVPGVGNHTGVMQTGSERCLLLGAGGDDFSSGHCVDIDKCVSTGMSGRTVWRFTTRWTTTPMTADAGAKTKRTNMLASTAYQNRRKKRCMSFHTVYYVV
jgi:hypothetical protein